MPIIQKLKQKKIRYILYSFLMFLLYMWAGVIVKSSHGESVGEISTVASRVPLILLLATLGGSYLTQYPSISYSKGSYRGLIVSLLPISLSLGVYLSFYHFPNFSTGFRIASLLLVSVLLYLIGLVNNIFLVVDEKEEPIPLYRVAVAWSQILLVIISIPIYVGIYKLDLGPVNQSLLAGVPTFIFTVYYFWSLSFDRRTRRINLIEASISCAFSTFMLISTSLAVSFIPAEAFMRGLFSAAVLLFGLNYFDGHMKNRLNIGFIYLYGGIFAIFLFFILAFRP